MSVSAADLPSASPRTASPANPGVTVQAGKFNCTYWTTDSTFSAKVWAKTNGWIAMGFAPKAIMLNANIIIGTIENGKPLISDDYGVELYAHKPDTLIGGKYDILSGDVKQENGITTMTFTIPLDSKDPKDTKLVKGQKIKVIFSCGSTNDIRKKHSNDASTSITL